MRSTSIISRIIGAGFFASTLVTAGVAADKVIYQLDWLPGGDKAPIYVCMKNGFCKDAGLEVSIAAGRGSTDAITKLATGSSHIGSAGLGALMAARAKEKVPVTAVMSIFNKGPHAFYTVKDKGIAKIADLKGKRIATSPFTSSNVFLPLVLADLGMTMKDIKLTKADPGALGPMLMTGRTDAMIAWLTDVTRYTSQAKAAGKEIVFLPWSAVGLNLYSASLVASDKFLKEKPDVAKRFVAAFKKSIEFAQKNPEAAAKSVVAVVPELASKDVKGSLTDTMALVFNEVTKKDGLGAFEPRRLAETWNRVAKSQKLDPKSLKPEDVVTRKFLPKI